jgi:hypothetical protein
VSIGGPPPAVDALRGLRYSGVVSAGQGWPHAVSLLKMPLLQGLAPLTPGVRHAEGCFGRHLLREDPAAPLVQVGCGGRPPRRPAGAGLGVQVDQAMLERWAVDQAVVA